MGHLVIVSGLPATGTGKTVVVARALTLLSDAVRIITCTTRPSRDNESDGKDYYFLSREEFQEEIATTNFLEYDQHYLHWYGTRHTDLVKMCAMHNIAILTVDLAGAETFKSLYPDACFIAINAHKDDAAHFMAGRGDKPEKIAERLTNAQLQKEQIAFERIRFNFTIDNKPGNLDAVTKQFIDAIGLYVRAFECMTALRKQKTP